MGRVRIEVECSRCRNIRKDEFESEHRSMESVTEFIFGDRSEVGTLCSQCRREHAELMESLVEATKKWWDPKFLKDRIQG